jgi:glycosyltransferase involved in cell wall biosynthesis
VTRILIYSDSSGIYGAEQINHVLAMTLRKNGYETIFAQPEAENVLVKNRAAQEIEHYWLPDENIYDWRHPAPSLSDPAPAESCLDAVRPDLVLFADSFPFANLAAKQAAARRGIPYLVLIHCVQTGWADNYRKFLSQLPCVYRSAAEVVAVSTQNLELLKSDFGLTQSCGRVILNGRPDEFFVPRSEDVRLRIRKELGFTPENVVALSIGRMEFVKGWQHQLDALPLLNRCEHWKQLRFIWVGDGTLLPQVNRISRFLAKGRVRLIREHHDVPSLLDAADLVVHPAEFEGMPLVVLESMAKGLPVIASSVSGIPEALGDTGLLLRAASDEPCFSERLAASICGLAGDEEKRVELGRSARARALTKFAEARMISDWLALIQSVAGTEQ